jgi:very-short-patch-repair endonuclease
MNESGEWDRIWDVQRRMAVLETRWFRERQTPKRWQLIRDAYSLKLPDILMTGTSPYFLDWDFTPIERLAWHDIRTSGLPLYPQFPAGRFFLDFGDPILQIGVELDGKDYHDAERDRRRDEQLWELGWRIFRVPGRNSLPAPHGPFAQLDDQLTSEADTAYRARTAWGERWSEGFFWALAVIYYGQQVERAEERDAAYRILHRHRLVQFPLEADA